MKKAKEKVNAITIGQYHKGQKSPLESIFANANTCLWNKYTDIDEYATTLISF